MDSKNLPETQSTPLNCRNTASNTNPISCAGCISKDYIQNVPQAYCFRAIHPGISRCKHFQDSSEENFTIQQPFFSPFPLFQPFFHNSGIPANFCCAHNRLEDTVISEEQKHKCENEKAPRSSNHHTFCQKKINNLKGTKTTLDENARKNNSSLEPEAQFLGHPLNTSNPADPEFSSFSPRCACGDPIAWSCSPFIAPVVSYCLFWNSQKSNMNILSTSCTNGASETMCQKKYETLGSEKHSGNNDSKEKSPKNLDVVKDISNSLIDSKNCSQESCLEIDRHMENNESSRRNSSTFLHLHSLNYNEGANFKSAEDENNRHSKSGSYGTCAEEGEDTEIEGFDSMDHIQSDECLKLNKKIFSNDDTNVYFSLHPDSPTESQSLSDLKVRKNDADFMDVLFPEKQSNILGNSAGNENAFHLLEEKDLDSECKTRTPNKKTKLKERMPSKKFIKNFTITDETNNVPYKEAQIFMAASGDLGGDNYINSEVNILSYEGDQQENIYQETKKEENLESKESLLKDLRNLEENKSESFHEKSTNENFKNVRNFKSGSAKQSDNSRPRESKSDLRKSTKTFNKEPNQRELSLTKCKHNYTSNDNTVGVGDQTSKIQKVKNCTVVQQQIIGPETQHKTCNKSQPVKKEEKISATKIRPLSKSQKIVKCNCKK